MGNAEPHGRCETSKNIERRRTEKSTNDLYDLVKESSCQRRDCINGLVQMCIYFEEQIHQSHDVM